jgi:hypothetical protein
MKDTSDIMKDGSVTRSAIQGYPPSRFRPGIKKVSIKTQAGIQGIPGMVRQGIRGVLP